MEAKVLRLTLLNHLFYYTEVSGGSTSASVTGDFIGDLALTYAFKKALRSDNNYYRFLQKPEYEEMKEFGFYCSVARPLTRSHKTEAYIQSTAFNTDGILAMTPGVSGSQYQKAGKSPYKTFRQAQGIRLGSSFQALFLSRERIDLPPVIRVGRALESLVAVEEIILNKKAEDEFWLNAFSLKAVFNNLDTAIQILVEEQKINFSFILENYNLVKQVSLENARTIFQSTFDNG